MHRLLITATFAALLIACSGGDDKGSRVLHFTGRDETEAHFRNRIREITGENPIGISLMCTQIRGLSGKEAAAVQALKPGDPEPEAPEGTTPKPGQKGVPKDTERAAVILQEECKRMFPK
jgi:hypothetical protein